MQSVNETKIGRTVISTAGHDRGSLYIVVSETDGMLLLCDGKRRRLDHPKKKKSLHCETVSVGEDSLVRLLLDGSATDSRLRRELSGYRKGRRGELMTERRDSSAKG